MLAQQYKAMYPTLEIDVEGELVKLKVKDVKHMLPFQNHFILAFTLTFCVFHVRTMRRRSSPW